MTLTTKVLLNSTRQKHDGSYPLIIRMTYNRRFINIPVGFSLKEKDWDTRNQQIKSSSLVSTNITRLNNSIRMKTAHIYDVITKLEDENKIYGLSMKDIKKHITSEGRDTQVYVYDFIRSIIDELIQSKKKGNAEVYSNLLKKLKTHRQRSRY